MAEKPMGDKTSDRIMDLWAEFAEYMKDQIEKGRDMVWIDKRLLGWVDKQVEAQIYRSRSHAMEVLIQEKMREEKE